jgi:hypothetical protein
LLQRPQGNCIFPVLTDQTQIKSLGSVTGRVGYSWDRFLAYVKGGGAWLQSDYNVQFGGANVVTASSTSRERLSYVTGTWPFAASALQA